MWEKLKYAFRPKVLTNATKLRGPETLNFFSLIDCAEKDKDKHRPAKINVCIIQIQIVVQREYVPTFITTHVFNY